MGSGLQEAGRGRPLSRAAAAGGPGWGSLGPRESELEYKYLCMQGSSGRPGGAGAQVFVLVRAPQGWSWSTGITGHRSTELLEVSARAEKKKLCNPGALMSVLLGGEGEKELGNPGDLIPVSLGGKGEEELDDPRA